MKTVNSREEFLSELIKFVPAKCCAAEIGVLHGDFSQMILDIVKPSRLFLIDPYTESEETYGGDMNNLSCAYSTEIDYNGILVRFKKEIESLQVIVDRRFSHDAVKDYPDETFDLIYLDAAHDYDSVQKDLNDWLPKLKPGSIFAGHDFVHLAIFGVVDAVMEFILEQGFEMILFNDNGGDFALRKINKP